MIKMIRMNAKIIQRQQDRANYVNFNNLRF